MGISDGRRAGGVSHGHAVDPYGDAVTHRRCLALTRFPGGRRVPRPDVFEHIRPIAHDVGLYLASKPSPLRVGHPTGGGRDFNGDDVAEGADEDILRPVAAERHRDFACRQHVIVEMREVADALPELLHLVGERLEIDIAGLSRQPLDGGSHDPIARRPRVEYGYVTDLEMDPHRLRRVRDRWMAHARTAAQSAPHLDKAFGLEDPQGLPDHGPRASELRCQLVLDRQRVAREQLGPGNAGPDLAGDGDRSFHLDFPSIIANDFGVTTTAPELYYDPYDFEIDTNPYPIWQRLRDEQPLYYNERYDFYALSRFDDVEKASVDWRTYSSAHGTVLEIIKANMEMPPGSVIFEDPPLHDKHRALLSRVFTPRKVSALEPKIREFCARSLDPLVGSGGFDFIRDLGAQMPMRTIGMLLGIPEDDQEALRDRIDEGLRLDDGTMPDTSNRYIDATRNGAFEEYLDWRAEHPSDDLMTELLQAEFEDDHGVTRRLTREELLNYINLLAAAGNETTTRLIGWTGKVLAEHPDQRRKVAENRDLVPNAIEEILRFESPSPVQARYVTKDAEWYGTTVPEGSAIILLTASGNRDERKFPGADQLDITRKIDHHLSFGYGIHFCMGAALARMEGRVALDEVLKRWTDWEIDWDGAVQARTSTVRGWEKLPVLTK